MYRLKNGKKVHFVNVFNIDHEEKIREFQQTITNNKGVVYAFYIENAVKIGCTRNPYDRIKTHYRAFQSMKLHTGQDELEFGKIIMTDPCFDYYGLENKLHRIFKHWRIKGSEFFKIDFDDVVLAMDKEFQDGNTNDDHQVEVLFSNLLNQLAIEMDAHGGLLAAYANALVESGKQLSEAEARISELEEMLLIREYTN